MQQESSADPQSFVKGGPTLTRVFLVDQGKEDQNINKRGPLSACQQNAIKWCFTGGPIVANH